MADMPSNTPSSVPSPAADRTTDARPSRGVSKTSLMLAFAAGAAFSWILMQTVEDDNRAAGPNIILVRPL